MRKINRPAVMAAAVAALLIIAGTAVFILWLHGAFLPRWIEWDKEAYDRIPEGVSARLDKGWLVQDALCFDIDGDGTDESILLVWKRGSYGPRKPTWVKKDEIGFSQHIFIYKDYGDPASNKGRNGTAFEEGWHPLWMSSKLVFETSSFREGDEIKGTGRKSLDTISPDGSVSRWGWFNWGLTKIE